MMNPDEGAKSSQSLISLSTNPLLLCTLSAIFTAARNYLWPTEGALTTLSSQNAFDVEDEISQMLLEIRERPAPEFEGWQILGNTDVAAAQLIVLNEDPFDIRDIETIMRFIRYHAQTGDAVIFEGDGHELYSLEGVFLMRVLCLQALVSGASTHQSMQSCITQRQRRRDLVTYFSELLGCAENAISQNRFLSEGIFVYRFCSTSDQVASRAQDRIRFQVKSQIATLSEVLTKHRRVFIIRTRAFSLHFMQQYLQQDLGVRNYYEELYGGQLRSIEDLLIWAQFGILNSVSSMHRYLQEIPHVEFLRKR